jgi:EAL domain-containing protein (putative c-di-GMP-specific phosphodiesterase class I)
VQLSIDDFGTGYSSLAYLKRFAVDKLKIDQSFVRDIVKDKEDSSIVKTIIQMAKSFNLKAIAEGVENEEVLEVLKEFGCDEVQGYHFAKPMVADEFRDYYKKLNIKR